MKTSIFFLLFTAFALPAAANVNGEVAWTKLSFCNGAGYCVDAESKNGVGITSLKVARNGVEMTIPRSAIVIAATDAPLLNEARLISVQRKDGAFGNTLEIPYLKFIDKKPVRVVMRLNFDSNDLFISSP